MSTTRRVFLRSAALSVVALPVLAADLRPVVPLGCAVALRFDRVLFDARRVQALAFGETARQFGARTLAISGAMEDPCYDKLKRCWQQGRTPIAGMTDFRTLSLLQVMAADAGLRPVLRIQQAKEDLHWGINAAYRVLKLDAGAAGEMGPITDLSVAKWRGVDSRSLVAWAIA